MPVEWRRAAGFVLAACLAVPGGVLHAQDPPSPGRLQLCAACHGPEGRSQDPAVPSLAGQPRLFIENQLVMIREGLRVVPAMQGVLAGIDDPEIIALAKYFNAQAPAQPPAAGNPAAYERGRALSARLHCGSCHLADYSGQQQVPRLAAQPEVFLRNSMKQFRDHPGPGRDTMMQSVLYGVKDDEIADLAHYLAHFRK